MPPEASEVDGVVRPCSLCSCFTAAQPVLVSCARTCLDTSVDASQRDASMASMHARSSTSEAPANGVFAEGSSHRRHQWHRHAASLHHFDPQRPAVPTHAIPSLSPGCPCTLVGCEVSPTLACSNSYPPVQLHTRIVLLWLVILILEAARHAAPGLCSAWQVNAAGLSCL